MSEPLSQPGCPVQVSEGQVPSQVSPAQVGAHVALHVPPQLTSQVTATQAVSPLQVSPEQVTTQVGSPKQVSLQVTKQVPSQVSPDKVFCLYTNPERLTVLRKTRLERFGEINKDYANPEFVRKECIYAQQIFSRHPKWLRINVTSKAIEEIASEIIALRRSHK